MRPPDFETPVALLDSFLTPLDAFYVRSHMPVPAQLDEAAWRLAVDGEAGAPLSLSVAELRQMPAATVTVTLECAGNGRAFFDPPVAGIQWRKGAVGTCTWTGVRVRRPGEARRRAAGRDAPVGERRRSAARHAAAVRAPGADGQGDGPRHDRRLRDERPADSGRARLPAPPGGARVGGRLRHQVANKLTLATAEHDGFWVATGYRYPTKRVAPGAAVDAKDLAPLTGLVVKSLITRPLDGAVVAPGKITVAGFAWAGESRHRARRRLGGRRRHLAAGTAHRQAAKFAWRRFELAFDATPQDTHTILSRATDASGVTQPIVPQWNPSGYLWNAPDQVRIEVKA